MAPTARADEAKPTQPETPMPPVEAFARFPVVDQIALSPDGTRVAIVTQRGDNKILIDFTVADQKPRVMSLGPSKIRNLFWGDNRHVVIVSSTTAELENFVGSRHEFSIAHMLDVDAGKDVVPFAGDKDFHPIVIGDLQRIKTKDGYRLTASNYQMTDEDLSLCLYSFALDLPRGNRLSKGNNSTLNWAIGPDGYLAAYADFDDERKEWGLYFNKAGPGKVADFEVVYEVKDTIETPDLLGLGRDGLSVIMRVPQGDYSRFYEVGADGKLNTPLDAEHEDQPRTALFHPTTGRLAGFARHDDSLTFDYFEPVMKRLTDAIGSLMGNDYRAYPADYAEDPRQMIIYGESADDAGSYYFADFSTGKNVRVASNYPNIPEEWITQKQAIRYKAADGLDIHGYLTLPPFKAPKNLPLIVLPHGGPQARDYIDYDWQTQVFASRGYAVLQPNFRGSEGFGEAFVRAGYGEWGGKMQTDLSDGVRELARQGIVDPKRVAIFGASYGGYAALAGATLDPGIYTCAVSIAGVSDIKGMLEFERANSTIADSSTMIYWKQFMGDAKRYDDISPARQAAKADCPVLLIHGTDDTVVPIDQSQRMQRALQAAGKPVEFVTFKGQDHWETIPSARVTMMQAAVDFIQKHNPA